MLRLLTKEDMEEIMNAENLREIEEGNDNNLSSISINCSDMSATFSNPPSVYTEEQLKDLRAMEYLIEVKAIVTE